MKLRNLIFVMTAAILTSACSNQYREVDSGVTATQLLSMLDEVATVSTTSTNGTSVSTVAAMKDQPGVRIYFAESTGPKSKMGPVASVLSFADLGFLGSAYQGLNFRNYSEARIFFFDIPSTTGHQNGLIVGTSQTGGTMTYSAFQGSGSVHDEIFEANLGSISVKSWDITDGDFDQVIQMLVWDDAGYLGKFSTLAGFGD